MAVANWLQEAATGSGSDWFSDWFWHLYQFWFQLTVRHAWGQNLQVPSLPSTGPLQPKEQNMECVAILATSTS